MTTVTAGGLKILSPRGAALREAAPHLRNNETFYTLRTNQTTRAMMIIVPRMPPIYIGISVYFVRIVI